MPVITRKLLRKRSEHNEGMISTLEELTLHQEELEGINEVLGTSCRKLKILYLQNNLIWKIENLQHLKDLEYLNLALNNISKIEGLQNCEFLHKLDLTVNFIDLDELEASVDHLESRERLRDMYMMGNPCQSNWPGFTSYIIARLPQLQTLDGTEVTRSMQITARQKLPQLEQELQQLAAVVREEKAEKARRAAEISALKRAEPKSHRSGKEAPRVQELDENDNVICEDVDEEEDDEEEAARRAREDDLTENTPEARQEIYRELAQQKKEKQDREDAMKPRERNYEAEQAAALEEIRRKEEESGEKEVRQKNEGGWEFRWDEDSRPGHLVLDVAVARHLDSSLIDVDVHPWYVSMVIKSKVLRLRNPAEVKAGESKCQRSKTTGSLMVIMPKVNAKETTIIPAATKGSALKQANKSKQATNAVAPPPKKMTLQEQMMQLAMAEKEKLDLGTSVKSGADIKNIVPQPMTQEHVSEGGLQENVFVSHAKSLVTEID